MDVDFNQVKIDVIDSLGGRDGAFEIQESLETDYEKFIGNYEASYDCDSRKIASNTLGQNIQNQLKISVLEFFKSRKLSYKIFQNSTGNYSYPVAIQDKLVISFAVNQNTNWQNCEYFKNLAVSYNEWLNPVIEDMFSPPLEQARGKLFCILVANIFDKKLIGLEIIIPTSEDLKYAVCKFSLVEAIEAYDLSVGNKFKPRKNVAYKKPKLKKKNNG
ncbi:hypothetical protein [Snodgrassella sp. CFCC 13594]|uniref:hypothetical protein n=1 Tax=Snodgrassella sp. CFCC 13594 TaxID=1775559 RepID=UPI000B06DFA7|nr:hypothetical protein [Snodgrassella sp. CFCC 13594]